MCNILEIALSYNQLLKVLEAVYIDRNLHLVKESMVGSRAAQFELYKLYVKSMYNVALRILNNEEEAEDVLQESFLDAFTRIKDFRQESTFGLWLKQIVINKSINCLRKRKFEIIPLDKDIELEDDTNSDYSEIELKVEEIKRAMKLLPDGYRIVLSLYILEGYDHEEIAHILKITENTSRSQYMRAKIKLKNILEKKGVNYER